ncbi:MAG: hypothetical protein AAGA93_02065 [Actinomycetota bacterium]
MIFRRDPLPNPSERTDDAQRCLLVAHNAPPTPRLCRLMEERCSSTGHYEMHVVVTRFRRSVLVTDPVLGPRAEGKRLADDRVRVDDQTWDVAEARLDSFMRALGDLGQPLSGEILAGNVRRRVRALLSFNTFDEVVVMTSASPRRWPTRDLASKVRQMARVPVTLIPADDLAA